MLWEYVFWYYHPQVLFHVHSLLLIKENKTGKALKEEKRKIFINFLCENFQNTDSSAVHTWLADYVGVIPVAWESLFILQGRTFKC